MMHAVRWPSLKVRTGRNSYRVNYIEVTCVVLLRIATPMRWVELELLFGKRWSALSEIFWEALEGMMGLNGYRLITEMNSSLVQERATL